MTDKTLKKNCTIIDEWFANGRNGVKAYQAINPNASYEAAAIGFNRMYKNVKILDYIESKESIIQTATSNTLEQAIEADLKIINDFDKIKAKVMAISINSSKEEIKAIEVQLKMFSSSMLNGAKERLNKMCGHYEKDNAHKTPEIAGFVINEIVVRKKEG